MKFTLYSSRTLVDGGLRPAAVTIRDGRIVAIGDSPPPGAAVQDLGDRVLMAGLVDTHVHINEPGRTEWEGFATATTAAALWSRGAAGAGAGSGGVGVQVRQRCS